MEQISFYKTKETRREILREYGNLDHVYFKGNNNVLISVPHGVVQTRLGKQKGAEIGTIPMGMFVKEKTGSHIIIKTKNNYDDANFDEDCSYRQSIDQIIKENNIKYLIDFHGLASKRRFDINLGTRLGTNTDANPDALDRLLGGISSEFTIGLDQPFRASIRTISGYYGEKYDIFTIQIEVNCSITNNFENINKFNRLVQIFSKWINSLN